MDAVFFSNGIGNFVMMTPFLQNLNDPVIFIPEDDGRRDAIETISCWEIIPYMKPEQLSGYDRVFQMFATSKYQIPGVIRQRRPVWTTTEHEIDYNLKLLNGHKRYKYKIKYLEDYKTHLGEGEKLVCLNNGSNPLWTRKRWSGDKWIDLCGAILDKYEYVQFAMLGSDEDGGLGKMLVKKYDKKVWDFTGLLPLDVSVGVLNQCDLFITTDSGLMHCASALNKSIVVLWGATNWDKNKPVNKNVIKIENGDGGCGLYPCYGTPEMWDCKQAKCMDAITVEQVMEGVEDARQI